jgi:UDP-N-acetylmuramyl pentapeptide synthase
MWPLLLKDLASLLEADLDPSGLSAHGEREFCGVCTDSRSLVPGQIFFALPGDRFDGHDFIDNVIRTPGTPCVVRRDWYQSWSKGNSDLPESPFFLVDDTVAALRQLALAFRLRMGRRPVVAVGGSNGKTTTKEMLVCMLGGLDSGIVATQKSENGFVGIPKTLCSKHLTASARGAVVEVGIDAVGAMAHHVQTVQPSIALLTSLSEEHLEGLNDFETVVCEELTLLIGRGAQMPAPPVRIWQCADPEIRQACGEHLAPADVVVIPARDVGLAEVGSLNLLSRAGAVVSYSAVPLSDLSSDVDLSLFVPAHLGCARGACGSSVIGEPIWSARVHVPMAGLHHAANAALAFASALVFEAVVLMGSRNVPYSGDIRSWTEVLQVRDPDESISASSTSDCEWGCVPVELFAEISERFRRFSPPELRSTVEHFGVGRSLLIDCYNANPGSMRASLELLSTEGFKKTHKIVFLADMLDLGQASADRHRELISVLASMPESQLYLYGKEMYSVFMELSGATSEQEWASLHREGLHHLDSEADPTQWLESLVLPDGPVVILLKGSRGMKLERLVPGLRQLLLSS